MDGVVTLPLPCRVRESRRRNRSRPSTHSSRVGNSPRQGYSSYTREPGPGSTNDTSLPGYWTEGPVFSFGPGVRRSDKTHLRVFPSESYTLSIPSISKRKLHRGGTGGGWVGGKGPTFTVVPNVLTLLTCITKKVLGE